MRLLGGDPNGCELPTLPKTNVAAENVVSRKERMIVYQLLIFRGYVNFGGVIEITSSDDYINDYLNPINRVLVVSLLFLKYLHLEIF